MIRKILIALDDDSDEKLALDTGFTLALQHDASVTVIVVSNQAQAWKDSLGECVGEETIHRYLFERREQSVQSQAEAYRIADVEVVSRSGISFIEVIRSGLSVSADLIVQASHTEDADSLFFTSADWHLMRKSPIPVLVVKEGWSLKPTHILVAVDVLSAQETINKDLLQIASTLALGSSAKLTVVSAWTVAGELPVRDNPWFRADNEQLDKIVDATRERAEQNLGTLQHWLEQQGLTADHWLVKKGPARDVIPAVVKDLDVDLVTMGTVGRTGIPGFLIGNTAETVLSKVGCSVLTLKPETFISPAV